MVPEEAFQIIGKDKICIIINRFEDIQKVNDFFDFDNEWNYLGELDEYPHLLHVEKEEEDDEEPSHTYHNDYEDLDEYLSDDDYYCFNVNDIEDVFNPLKVMENKIKQEIGI